MLTYLYKKKKKAHMKKQITWQIYFTLNTYIGHDRLRIDKLFVNQRSRYHVYLTRTQ